MALTKEDRERIREVVAVLYARGYSEGMARAVKEYTAASAALRPASIRMASSLDLRLSLVDRAVDGMLDRLVTRAANLREKGMSVNEIVIDLGNEARRMAQNKAQEIARMEFAQARFDGASNIMDESGMKYQWRFAHLELGRPGHIECPICEAIRERAPFTTDQAEAEGFPSVPHPGCDHGWIIVPEGEQAKAEEFPTGPLKQMAGGSVAKHNPDGSCTPGETDNYPCGAGIGGSQPKTQEEAVDLLSKLPKDSPTETAVPFNVKEWPITADIEGLPKTMQRVKMDELVATQDYVDPAGVVGYINDPQLKSKPPEVYRKGKKYYIGDGHHRATALKLLGNNEIDVLVIDMRGRRRKKRAVAKADDREVINPSSKATFDFPSFDGREEFHDVMKKSGYVEHLEFASERFGYFCGTCGAFDPKDGTSGYCLKFKFPDRSYGCCNGWYAAPQDKWIPASGQVAHDKRQGQVQSGQVVGT